MPFAATWTQGVIMLSKSDKEKYYMILLYVEYKKSYK